MSTYPNSAEVPGTRRARSRPTVSKRHFGAVPFRHPSIVFDPPLFDDPDWTFSRRANGDVIMVDLAHLYWRSMEYMFRYVYCNEGQDVFRDIASVKSSNRPVELVFSVIAAAVINQHTRLQKACSLLRGARLYDAAPLIESLQFHIAVNMESMLQSNLLDDLPDAAPRGLSSFVRQQQTKKQPLSRSGQPLTASMEKWGHLPTLQDIAEPFIFKPRKISRLDTKPWLVS
ncbi:hypothetical protein FRC04_008584 [Tulasnella sp. 424]|nr:hypothetical protein FRC04_008584 [Tulasnella sp. 424]